MEIICDSVEQTMELGKKLGENLTRGMVLTLNGDLGAGKTTFTKGIAKGLGIEKVVSSPTFTILKQYQGRLNLNHFDAYRLEGQDIDLGFEDLIYSDDVSIIEWSGFIEEILPEQRLDIAIEYLGDNSRRFNFNPRGQKYLELVEVLI
ncbi:MAG: tRNA (adenosine(37)-N6)-threonylcarbamoyltransferase complex ATPase subunit type 1 TsaE [Erysipelotrichaceae bacterium]|nr:tRNA (adenosine(37)-N6)-threonylcarbamoyltransferase complex ATPase subunit type 1 TsaE [Erysipelotrichaceae bacterium]MDD3810420.1 tRNA (adenosine(37)-N6)-threonylcarbamoyltransferase complex ATPase subunit type 1 TsaE [Erysipelotrichaceae bacterium]